MARRDNREYRTYLRAEQRRQRGCIARRMQRHLHHGLLGRSYLNEATSAARHSASDRFPSRRGVQYSAIFSRQPAPHRFV